MNRNYKNNDKNLDTNFFIGTEVENTRTKGMKTLFVVGLHSAITVMQNAAMNNCEAIYFGANHSFDNNNIEAWEEMIHTVLNSAKNFWCILDFDVKYMETFLETGLAENIRMIPMVSVKMPYIEQLGYNAVIKIDDIDFNKTNPGVWTHSAQSLTTQSTYTHWQDYSNDERWC